MPTEIENASAAAARIAANLASLAAQLARIAAGAAQPGDTQMRIEQDLLQRAACLGADSAEHALESLVDWLAQIERAYGRALDDLAGGPSEEINRPVISCGNAVAGPPRPSQSP
jgi:hypothetical protein